MAYRIPGEGGPSDRFRKRMEMARQAQEENERARHDEIRRQIAYREWMEETRRWKERVEFDIYLISGMILDKLIRQRDENQPAETDGEWNDQFCEAVRLIPEAKRFMEEMSMRVIQKEENK